MALLLLRQASRQAPRLSALGAVKRAAPAATNAMLNQIVAPKEAAFVDFPPSCLEATKRFASHWSHEQPHHTFAMIEDRIMLVLKCYDKIDPEKVTVDSHFINDLGLDSLDHVEIVFMLEEEFMFEFPTEDWERMWTPADFKQYIADRFDVFH